MSSSEGVSIWVFYFISLFAGPFSAKSHGSQPSIIGRDELADAVYASVEMAGGRVDGDGDGDGMAVG